jgi:creatinine amidohydrolase/Fe(II)-dependent formamide hydrolase-like protein
MFLHLSTWQEVEARLSASRTILVPIGSQEQHGPTGLCGTDWLCPEIIAREAERLGDLLVAPTFNIGMAQHHLAFPGTISLRPSTFMAAIADWVSSLARTGLDQIYFLNGHGGNVASIEAAFAEIHAAASFAGVPRAATLRLRNWWDLPRMRDLVASLFPKGHGSHATPSEIAVTQWAYPNHIKQAPCAPETAPFGPIQDAADYRARFPDGRIGSNPLLASPEKGGLLVAQAAAALLDDLATDW